MLKETTKLNPVDSGLFNGVALKKEFPFFVGEFGWNQPRMEIPAPRSPPQFTSKLCNIQGWHGLFQYQNPPFATLDII